MTKKKVLTTKEMLLKAQPMADKEVFIKSLDGNVILKNISFLKMVEMRSQHQSDDYPIAMVAACLGMEFEDAQALQENAGVFSELFNAVNAYLGRLSDDEIKN